MTDRTPEDLFGHTNVTIIEPSKGWRSLDVKELWAYRELFWVLTLRDIKVRYKQTVLGFAWAVLQPVMMMVVFSIFFGRLAGMPSDGVPYPIFVYTGLLPWNFFSNAISNSGTSLVGSSHLVSKVYFPRLVIPLASIGSSIVDFVIAGAILLLLMLYYGLGWSLNLLLAPAFVAGVVLIALGVGKIHHPHFVTRNCQQKRIREIEIDIGEIAGETRVYHRDAVGQPYRQRFNGSHGLGRQA